MQSFPCDVGFSGDKYLPTSSNPLRKWKQCVLLGAIGTYKPNMLIPVGNECDLYHLSCKSAHLRTLKLELYEYTQLIGELMGLGCHVYPELLGSWEKEKTVDGEIWLMVWLRNKMVCHVGLEATGQCLAHKHTYTHRYIILTLFNASNLVNGVHWIPWVS